MDAQQLQRVSELCTESLRKLSADRLVVCPPKERSYTVRTYIVRVGILTGKDLDLLCSRLQ